MDALGDNLLYFLQIHFGNLDAFTTAGGMQMMKTKLLVVMALACASAFAETRFSIGVNIGGYPGYAPGGYYVAAPPPAPPRYFAPPSPGPGFVWVSGYYYPVGRRYEWRPGFWSRPPRPHAVWIAPRYSRNRYFGGYWR